MCWVYWIERDSGGVRLLVFFFFWMVVGVCVVVVVGTGLLER